MDAEMRRYLSRSAGLSRHGRPASAGRCALACLLALALVAAEAPLPVPRPVAELLTAVAGLDPTEAVRRLDAWRGDPHALICLARGQARLRLDQPAAAEPDFRQAIALDPAVRQAHLGLARCAVAREDWTTACRAAAAGLDPTGASADELAFLAACAQRAGDWRLATLAAQQGILRFPDDERLRRAELAVLVNANRAEDARQAALALLTRAPSDPSLWRHYAWAAQECGREDEALAALEAALLHAPDDHTLRQHLAQRQLARGLPQAALATVRPLMHAPAMADDTLLLFASRAASEGGDPAQGRAWLAAVPEERRSRAQRVQAARLAVQAGDVAQAEASLSALVAAGERDPAVLVWAAALADERGDAARAEALYLQAASGEGAAATTANLRLAALYLRRDRRDEARALLAAHLARHPEDRQAQALLQRLAP